MKSRNNKPSLAPQNVSSNVWYYEEGRHLCFVVRAGILAECGHSTGGTIQFKVPLWMLEASIKRAPKRSKRH